MTLFFGLATLMALSALAFMLVPLLRHRASGVPLAVLGLALATTPASVWLYFKVSTWAPEQAAASAPSLEQIITILERRVAEVPDDVEGWRYLAQSYLALGRFADAEAALRRQWALTPVPSNDLRLALAEAMLLQDRTALVGEAGQLIEEVLANEPDNAKALWYGGLVAVQEQRVDDARARWSRLVALNPPPEVGRLIEQQIANLGDAAATGRSSSGPTPSGTGIEREETSGIRLQVSVAAGLPQPGPETALFIFARSADGGPPVAALRVPASELPGDFTLSDANAMLPGRSLEDFEELTLVARISQSGQPVAAPGDLYGEALYSRKQPSAEPISLVIDRTQE